MTNIIIIITPKVIVNQLTYTLSIKYIYLFIWVLLCYPFYVGYFIINELLFITSSLSRTLVDLAFGHKFRSFFDFVSLTIKKLIC